MSFHIIYTASLVEKELDHFYERHELILRSLCEEELQLMFRFRTYEDLRLRLQNLDLPQKIVCDNGTAMSDELVLVLVLRWMAFLYRLCDLGRFLDAIVPSFLLYLIISLTLYTKKKVLAGKFGVIKGDEILQNSERYTAALNGIYGEWLLVDTGTKSPIGTFRIANSCTGFIDGTARISTGPDEQDDEFHSDRAYVQCVEFWSIESSDGLSLNLFGPVEGPRHD